MCMYACMYIYMYVCMYMYMRICMHVYICVCVFACGCVYIYVYVCVYIYICTPVKSGGGKIHVKEKSGWKLNPGGNQIQSAPREHSVRGRRDPNACVPRALHACSATVRLLHSWAAHCFPTNFCSCWICHATQDALTRHYIDLWVWRTTVPHSLKGCGQWKLMWAFKSHNRPTPRLRFHTQVHSFYCRQEQSLYGNSTPLVSLRVGVIYCWIVVNKLSLEHSCIILWHIFVCLALLWLIHET